MDGETIDADVPRAPGDDNCCGSVAATAAPEDLEEAATAPSEEVHAGPAVHGVEAAQSSLPATQETTAQTIWRNIWRQKLKDQSTAPTLGDQTFAILEEDLATTRREIADEMEVKRRRDAARETALAEKKELEQEIEKLHAFGARRPEDAYYEQLRGRSTVELRQQIDSLRGYSAMERVRLCYVVPADVTWTARIMKTTPEHAEAHILRGRLAHAQLAADRVADVAKK